MNVSGNQREPRRARSASLPWSWAMLMVVLLSAAPTLAQPRTKLVGSAFDPAAVSVALRGERTRLDPSSTPQVKRKLAEEASGLAEIAGIALLPLRPPLSVPWRDGAPSGGSEGAGHRHYTWIKANGPRAPPAA